MTNRNKIITEPSELSIGQLYMYLEYEQRLCRGFCIKIEEEKVTFKDECGHLNELEYYAGYGKNRKKTYISEYNSRIFFKFQRLLEKQAKERNDLLYYNFVELPADEGTKNKWYNKLMRKGKK